MSRSAITLMNAHHTSYSSQGSSDRHGRERYARRQHGVGDAAEKNASWRVYLKRAGIFWPGLDSSGFIGAALAPTRDSEDPMTTKDDLHHLVDQLNEEAVGELLEYAQWLTAEEDEPLTDEELARVEAGEAELRRGESVTLDDLKRRLGL